MGCALSDYFLQRVNQTVIIKKTIISDNYICFVEQKALHLCGRAYELKLVRIGPGSAHRVLLFPFVGVRYYQCQVNENGVNYNAQVIMVPRVGSNQFFPHFLCAVPKLSAC